MHSKLFKTKIRHMEKFYLIALSKEVNNGINSVKVKTRTYDYKNPYSFDFYYDTDYEKPFKERMKNASNSGATLCGIIGDTEFKNGGITLKNLINGKQVFSKYEEILVKVKEVY